MMALKKGYNRNLEQQGSSCVHFKFLGPNPPLKINLLGFLSWHIILSEMMMVLVLTTL